MTISEEEIRKDYGRFLRQEAMRANCTQEEIIKILCYSNFEVFLQHVKLKEYKYGTFDNS